MNETSMHTPRPLFCEPALHQFIKHINCSVLALQCEEASLRHRKFFSPLLVLLRSA